MEAHSVWEAWLCEGDVLRTWLLQVCDESRERVVCLTMKLSRRKPRQRFNKVMRHQRPGKAKPARLRSAEAGVCDPFARNLHDKVGG